ncbi:fungal-specific transcription factor domain-containing protein [Xylogone sp. PMI_703]|nr:fungal-specific transcription factor domain-containing protein [Xylogone sp. PMI_703]
MRELTQRAIAIEKQIEERHKEHTKLVKCGSLPSTPESSIRDVNDVTAIFGLAPLTYLHVVVSGPNPNLPEIKSSVSRTITSLKELRDPQLSRNLAWPFCVTGCLAANGDRVLINDLMAAAGPPSQQLGNLGSVFCVVEECWRLRGSEQGLWEWRSVMAHLDEHFFLA